MGVIDHCLPAAMLLIASETIRSNRALNDVVREMSFTLSYFASPAKLRELMKGQSRRIVLLSENDLARENLSILAAASERSSFGVVLAANRASLRSTDQAELVDSALWMPHIVRHRIHAASSSQSIKPKMVKRRRSVFR